MSKEVVISNETHETVKVIEEYLKGNTAFTADQWLKGKIIEASDPDPEELVGLQNETNDLINMSVRTSLMIGGVRVIKRLLEDNAGGLKIKIPQGEVLVPPTVATSVTGHAHIEAVHYQQKPQWKDVDYDARMVIYRKGDDPLVVAFERNRVTRVEESLKGVESDGSFGFKVGINQKIDRFNLTRDESLIVRSALSGLNNHLRDNVLNHPSLVPTK